MAYQALGSAAAAGYRHALAELRAIQERRYSAPFDAMRAAVLRASMRDYELQATEDALDATAE